MRFFVCDKRLGGGTAHALTVPFTGLVLSRCDSVFFLEAFDEVALGGEVEPFADVFHAGSGVAEQISRFFQSFGTDELFYGCTGLLLELPGQVILRISQFLREHFEIDLIFQMKPDMFDDRLNGSGVTVFVTDLIHTVYKILLS